MQKEIKEENNLVDANDKIIYDNVIKKYHWIVEPSQKCILIQILMAFCVACLCSMF